MCPSCPLQILRIVHTIVIELNLPYPKVMREKPHPERLRDPTQATLPNPLWQFPHLQSMSCQRTPPIPSMSKLSSPPSLPSHPSPHLCSWIPEQPGCS